MLLERGMVERIILSRPAVEAGERLGFLPGDMKEKVDPYLRPLYDALYDMMPADKVERAHHRRGDRRSHRSPSCAAARWRMPPSSSTRRRTRRPCR
jgi:predicted ribonuclease YlaK